METFNQFTRRKQLQRSASRGKLLAAVIMFGVLGLWFGLLLFLAR